MRSLRRATVLTALICALVPTSAALAQSAGDDQYTDPLAPTAQQPPKDPAPAQDAPGADPSGSATDEAAGTAQDSAPAADDASPARPAAGAAPKQLPQTGFSVLLLIASGGPMLLAGVALARVVSRSAPTPAQHRFR